MYHASQTMFICVIRSDCGICAHSINHLLSICYALNCRDSFWVDKLRGVSGYREVKVFSVEMMPKLFTTCKEDFFDAVPVKAAMCI